MINIIFLGWNYALWSQKMSFLQLWVSKNYSIFKFMVNIFLTYSIIHLFFAYCYTEFYSIDQLLHSAQRFYPRTHWNSIVEVIEYVIGFLDPISHYWAYQAFRQLPEAFLIAIEVCIHSKTLFFCIIKTYLRNFFLFLEVKNLVFKFIDSLKLFLANIHSLFFIISMNLFCFGEGNPIIFDC